jgi:uncharacterized membrane protein YdjX (TVP38/TMEM64 family)
VATILYHITLACIGVIIVLFLLACLLAGFSPKSAHKLAYGAIPFALLAFFCAVFTFVWHLFFP